MTRSIFATFDKCSTIKLAMTIAAGSKEDGEGDDRMHASWRTVHRSSAQQPSMQTNLEKIDLDNFIPFSYRSYFILQTELCCDFNV